MNGVGDRCKAVLLLVDGPTPLDDSSCAALRGFHCACSVIAPQAGMAAEQMADHVLRLTEAFCARSNLPSSILSEEALGAMNVSDLKTPLTVAKCTTESIGLVRARLLVSEDVTSGTRPGGPPYCLLAVADLTRRKEVAPRGSEFPDAISAPFAWLRPPQSYLSEYQHSGALRHDSGNPTIALFPVHMYCCYPMIRDAGSDPACEDLSTENVCTLEAILRELGYKAGVLPKYGA